MEKKILLIIPFFTGLFLLIYSWYLSYPLSIDSPGDFVFNHISVLYWFALPLVLGSLFLMSLAFKNKYLKWIFSIIFLITLYSLSYFYVSMPSSDSQAFRGLNEYFHATKNLDPALPNHSYFQWPSFFILTDMVISISGLSLINFEFLLYAIIGFLYATGLYIYTSKKFKEGGFLMVASYFIVMTYFFNYQAVPFSLAFGILLVLLVLDTCPKNTALKLTMLILYASLLFTHAFVPLFFVLYLLIRSILDRNKNYGGFFLLTLISYLAVQLTFGRLSFAENIMMVMTRPAEYGSMIEVTSRALVQIPIDVTAQFFSRTVTIAFLSICVIGFVLLIVKRKINSIDKSILLTGIIYSGIGFVLYTLGARAISLIIVPVALGAAYLFENRFKRLKPYLASIFLVLIILFLFIPVHQSFGTSEVQFQTRETYVAQNFFIHNYDWSIGDTISLDYRVLMYIESKVPDFINYKANPEDANIIFFTTGLGKSLGNYTGSALTRDNTVNVLYDNGFSYLSIKNNP